MFDDCEYYLVCNGDGLCVEFCLNFNVYLYFLFYKFFEFDIICIIRLNINVFEQIELF